MPSVTRQCVLEFPDDEEFQSLLLGALSLLADEKNYEEFGALSPIEVSDAFRQTLFTFMEFDCVIVPVGAVMSYAGSTTPPSGFLLCDGAQYLQADYPALYAVIQLFFGGADAENFRVPDLRGKIPYGYDAGQAEFNARGAIGGAKTHTLSVAEIPSHNHDILAAAAAGGTSGRYAPGGATGTNNTTIIANKGGGSAHQNMPPYLTMNYIIKF